MKFLIEIPELTINLNIVPFCLQLLKYLVQRKLYFSFMLLLEKGSTDTETSYLYYEDDNCC